MRAGTEMELCLIGGSAMQSVIGLQAFVLAVCVRATINGQGIK